MHKHYWIKSDGTVMCNETGTNLPIGKPIECFPKREDTYLQRKLYNKLGLIKKGDSVWQKTEKK